MNFATTWAHASASTEKAKTGNETCGTSDDRAALELWAVRAVWEA